MAWLFAFIHHLAAFAIAAALAIELILIRDELTIAGIRRLAAADAVYGISAGVILVVGFLRVIYFEKGASYYFHSVPFIIKITLFAVIGLMSVYPTVQFLSWRKSARLGRLPDVAPARRRAIRRIIHIELAVVSVLLLCAALMARGVGYMS